jgi:hypothetical protein
MLMVWVYDRTERRLVTVLMHASLIVLHIIATIVMSIFIVAMMAFGAFAHGRRFRLYSLATIVAFVVFGAWAGFLARPMPGPTPWLGLAERVNIYATMLWIQSWQSPFCASKAQRLDLRQYGMTGPLS